MEVIAVGADCFAAAVEVGGEEASGAAEIGDTAVSQSILAEFWCFGIRSTDRKRNDFSVQFPKKEVYVYWSTSYPFLSNGWNQIMDWLHAIPFFVQWGEGTNVIHTHRASG